MAIGIVPQEITFDPFLSVWETLRLQSGYFGLRHNDKWLNELLEVLDLADKKKESVMRLSGGMKRRVLIAQALVHKPPLIVLDEPTAGVDINLRHSLWTFMEELNRKGHTRSSEGILQRPCCFYPFGSSALGLSDSGRKASGRILLPELRHPRRFKNPARRAS